PELRPLGGFEIEFLEPVTVGDDNPCPFRVGGIHQHSFRGHKRELRALARRARPAILAGRRRHARRMTLWRRLGRRGSGGKGSGNGTAGCGAPENPSCRLPQTNPFDLVLERQSHRGSAIRTTKKKANPIFAIGAKSRVTCPVSRPAVVPEAVEGFAADSLGAPHYSPYGCSRQLAIVNRAAVRPVGCGVRKGRVQARFRFFKPKRARPI